MEKEKELKPKVILFWTHFYGHFDFEFGFGQQPFIDAGCPVTNCQTTADPAQAEAADALIFHMRNVNKGTPLPAKRNRTQRYVFFLMEHPFNQWNNLQEWQGFFNLTMTYRLDSDVTVRYGRTEPFANRGNDINGEMHIHNKHDRYRNDSRKLVAWFVSNCNTHSKREDYVKELQKYIPVDIFGKCGPLQCPVNVTNGDRRMQPECYTMLEENYKFYLSFENIHCRDYVTEKMYNILPLDTVPVVMGGVDYVDGGFAPPHSVINVDQFKSPRDLAQYLLRLNDSPVEYWSYKDWKENFKVVKPRDAYKEAFCRLCEVLNDPSYPSKQYDNLHDWWGKDTACDRQVISNQKKNWD